LHYKQAQQEQTEGGTFLVAKITSDYLQPTITLLNLFNNTIRDTEPASSSDLTANLVKFALNADVHFKAKRYLGHLISRNVHGVCLNLLDKLSDMMLFYSGNGKIKLRINSNLNCVLISVFSYLFKNKTIEDKSESEAL
jgi:hypothetical protein